MSNKLLGIDIFDVSTTPKHEPGLIVSDIRGGFGEFSFKEFIDGPTQFRRFSPDAEYKYVRATATVTSGDACKVDVAATDEPAGVTPVTAITDAVDGIAITNIASGSYGFIQVRGRVPLGISSATAADRLGAKIVAAGVAAGASLAASATAGALQTKVTATQDVNAGKVITALDAHTDLDPGGGTDNRAEVYID